VQLRPRIVFANFLEISRIFYAKDFVTRIPALAIGSKGSDGGAAGEMWNFVTIYQPLYQ